MLTGALGGAALAAGAVATYTWIMGGNQRYVFASPIARVIIVAGAVAGFFLLGPPR